MRIRLSGRPEECEDMVARLGLVSDVQSVSTPYPQRAGDGQVRVYVVTAGNVCRHCAQPIRRDGVVWVHLHRETRTRVPHLTCGFDSELGTSAQPIVAGPVVDAALDGGVAPTPVEAPGAGGER